MQDWTEFESILVEKFSFHFLAQGRRRRTCEKIWKKIYFENPPILCSIATAGPENAREQNSNRFWLKKFPFIFWLKAAGADLWKVLKKIYFENPQILCSIATAGPENATEQNSNRFWLKNFRFIFGSRLQARTCEKFWKKYIWKIQQFHVDLQKQALKMQMNSTRIDFGWKSFISFLALSRRRDLWKNLKKIYFENPPILCSIATACPENAREQNSNRFWLKKFHFTFWLKAAGARTCEIVWTKYILKIHQFYFHLQKQDLENARRTALE